VSIILRTCILIFNFDEAVLSWFAGHIMTHGMANRRRNRTTAQSFDVARAGKAVNAPGVCGESRERPESIRIQASNGEIPGPLIVLSEGLQLLPLLILLTRILGNCPAYERCMTDQNTFPKRVCRSEGSPVPNPVYIRMSSCRPATTYTPIPTS
jgi:hypothetical protein